MAVVYTHSAFNTHAQYKRARVSYPFRNDPTLGTVLTRYFEGQRSSYSAPTLDSVDSEFSNMYCVGVKDLDHRDAELMRYEVDYATIPATRDDFDAVSTRFPGLSAATVGNSAKTVEGFLPSEDRLTATIVVPAHGYTTNRVLGYHIVLATPAGQFSIDGFCLVLGATVNNATVNIPTPVGVGADAAFFAGSVRSYDVAFPARGALTDTVPTRTRYDYFLPGVSSGISKPSDIALPSSFKVFNSAGVETETLSTTTMPTQAQYEAMIVGGQEILVQVARMRWRGNIYERGLRFARAT